MPPRWWALRIPLLQVHRSALSLPMHAIMIDGCCALHTHSNNTDSILIEFSKTFMRIRDRGLTRKIMLSHTTAKTKRRSLSLSLSLPVNNNNDDDDDDDEASLLHCCCYWKHRITCEKRVNAGCGHPRSSCQQQRCCGQTTVVGLPPAAHPMIFIAKISA